MTGARNGCSGTLWQGSSAAAGMLAATHAANTNYAEGSHGDMVAAAQSICVNTHRQSICSCAHMEVHDASMLHTDRHDVARIL